MSEDVYVLKKVTDTDSLRCLNVGESIAHKLHWSLGHFNNNTFGKYPTDEEIDDWFNALKSGKKIVNPMSPRDELLQKYKEYGSNEINWAMARSVIKNVVEIIAKEHPDVKDWLGDKDEA